MTGKTILGIALLLLGTAYIAGCMFVLKLHPNVWFAGAALLLGALLTDTADVTAALKEGAGALKGVLPGKGGGP